MLTDDTNGVLLQVGAFVLLAAFIACLCATMIRVTTTLDVWAANGRYAPVAVSPRGNLIFDSATGNILQSPPLPIFKQQQE